MDFQNVNPLNVWLNMISGNLLPMTADNSSFPIFWIIYGTLIWLLEILQTCVLIPGCFFVPKKKALKDGVIGIVVGMEVICTIIRICTCRGRVKQLIRKLNDVLSVDDEIMRNIVIETMKSMENPLKFYWSAGVISIIVWSSEPFMLVFQRNSFFYVDYKMPVVYIKEPITTSMFIFGSVIVTMSSAYIFTKKVGVDSYIINLLLLITAQYKYIALKLSMIFQDKFLQNDHNKSDAEKCYLNRDDYVKKKIKVLCRHHNTVIQIMLMFRKLLSLNISLIYVISVFRFCCISLMIISIPSETLWEICSISMYGIGGVVQLYIICFCMQQLLDASVNITEYAFHEKWYQYGKNMKRTFMFIIMANNLEIKLSTFEKYNLSLSSFITILNQSYSIALLLLKIN
ncbi:Odorant receptor Or1 [Trachymyrmex septentrionalis]|uniref:Odorant receptor n=1 Tax=Trachymyrmex septentrionalis TaxID=34720 RepID=A0A195FS07_9HYME|nr:Odorant receptor Or1 [Trachymyrmex septentrionalis]